MITKVGVLGSGTMGHGIAEACALAGYGVYLYDIDTGILQRAMEKMEQSLNRLHRADNGNGFVKEIMAKVTATTDLRDLEDSDLIIEAVTENAEIKNEVLKRADSEIKETCIFSTNTSTIPVTELAESTKRKGKFIGLHFFNPPVLMPLVEIIMGKETTEETFSEVKEFTNKLKKISIRVNMDIPGFVVNRLNDRMITESMHMVSEGVRPEILDAALKFRMNLPMGICELLDYVGIDTAYLAGSELRKRGFGGRDIPILRSLFEEGKFGVKTGSGFYRYEKGGKSTVPPILPTDEMYSVNPLRILAVVINEAAWLVRNNAATAEDVDLAMLRGMNWPVGPLMLCDKIGVHSVISLLEQMALGSDLYKPDQLLTEMADSRNGNAPLTFHSPPPGTVSFGPINYTESGHRARITMNRPEKLNALSTEMWKGLADALKKAVDSNAVRAVILEGSGRAFSAGDDIAMMNNWKGDDAANWMVDYASPLVTLMLEYPKTLIASVDGVAAGGGCELVMLCDIVISTNESVFSIPEGLIGAMPPLASSLGMGMIDRRLLRYALTGEKFSATRARELGLVDIMVEREQLAFTVNELADKAESLAPLSSLAIKRVSGMVRSGYRDALEHGKDELVGLASTDDFSEGQKSFALRRKPKWMGK